MTRTGQILALITIAILMGMIAALITGFVKWLDTKKISSGILTGGGAFLAVLAAMVTLFGAVGLLNV